MSDLNQLLDLSDRLDQLQLASEADVIDSYVDQITKQAKPNIHKSGLKEETIQQHLELLEGYKKALSHYQSEYKKALQSNNEKDSPNYGKLREITVNLAYNKNSVHFHDLFLSDVINNNPYSIEKDSQMRDLLKQLYDGDYNKFSTEIKRLAMIPRSGWVLFSYCTDEKVLAFNVIDLHDQHLIACYTPILALDCWEHSYYNDFGTDKEAYVEWFLSRLDWRNPRKRLKNLMRIK